jgi:hypothetical protein
VSDIGAVSEHKGVLTWNVKLSRSGALASTSLGESGDTIVSGCTFSKGKGASIAVLQNGQRSLLYKNFGDPEARRVVFRGLGNCNLIGCGDTDGDGIDELLFSTRGERNRSKLVGYDISGRRRFSTGYDEFLRGFVVDRPASPVPLVAIIGAPSSRGRQVRITTMAGSFSFPRFFVERGQTFASGTFTNQNNEQVSGIFWTNRSNGMVHRRLLSRGAETTELFKLPRGFSLVRPQGVVRTAKSKR